MPILALRPATPAPLPCPSKPGAAAWHSFPLLPCCRLGSLCAVRTAAVGAPVGAPGASPLADRRLPFLACISFLGALLAATSAPLLAPLPPRARASPSGTLGPGCFVPGHSVPGCAAPPCAGPGRLPCGPLPPSGGDRAGSHCPRPILSLAAPGRSQGVPSAADYQ